MGKKEGKKEVKYKAVMNRDQLADYLEGLANGFRQGSIAIDAEKGDLTLQPTETMSVKIEAAEKKDKYKMELAVSWSRVAPEGDLAGCETEAASEGGSSDDEAGQAGEKAAGDDEEEGEPESGADPLTLSYKKLKKKMQKEVKEIKAVLDRGEMPALELVEACVNDAQAITSVPGKGDEHYPRFNDQAQVLLSAARSGDQPGFAAALEALLEMKKECHSKYK